MSEIVSEAEIQAYVDAELDLERRVAVQEYLSRQPDLAAQVMADLRGRAELGAAFRGVEPPGQTVLALASRLERHLAGRRFRASAWRALAAVLLIAVGWCLHLQVSLLQSGSDDSRGTGAFMADALHAYRTELLRAQMASQVVATRYDPDEIREKTQIAMPRLSPGWEIRDVQVFPSREGPSIEATISAGPLGIVSLFAAKAERLATVAPQVSKTGTETAVYWRTGRLEYALIGTGSVGALTSAADAMFSQMN